MCNIGFIEKWLPPPPAHVYTDMEPGFRSQVAPILMVMT